MIVKNVIVGLIVVAVLAFFFAPREWVDMEWFDSYIRESAANQTEHKQDPKTGVDALLREKAFKDLPRVLYTNELQEAGIPVVDRITTTYKPRDPKWIWDLKQTRIPVSCVEHYRTRRENLPPLDALEDQALVSKLRRKYVGKERVGERWGEVRLQVAFTQPFGEPERRSGDDEEYHLSVNMLYEYKPELGEWLEEDAHVLLQVTYVGFGSQWRHEAQCLFDSKNGKLSIHAYRYWSPHEIRHKTVFDIEKENLEKGEYDYRIRPLGPPELYEGEH